MTAVRSFLPADWPATWALVEPVIRAGDTYCLPTDMTEADARRVWTELPEAAFVALDDAGTVVGTYYLKANQPGPGAHVGNCGYIVGEGARGRGVASAMLEHSEREATARGYRALQFNMVVSTNDGAVRLWRKHGFEIVGTLPGAFRHPTRGYVDAFVMYKRLEA